MKITHIIESSGGSADFVLYLVEYLQEHEHIIVHSDRTFGKKLKEVKSSFSRAQFVHWRNAQREIRFWADVKATVNLYQILRHRKTDVIHLHSSKAGFLGRLVCFLLQRQNVIYTPNGLSFLRLDVPPFKRRIYLWLERIGYKLSGRIISCSKTEAEELIKNRIPSEFINNGTEIFETQVHESSKKCEIVIATIGRVTIQKNPPLFNKIAKRLESGLSYRFIWIGAGELEHELTSGNVHITGWLDRNKAIEKLHEADIYLSTASWEGLPFAVLEAMNMQKPLILSRCVGNIDLVKDNYNGFLYDTAEEAVSKIQMLCENRSLISCLGRNSKQLAKQCFDVKKMALKYEQAYRQPCEDKTCRSKNVA